MIMKFPAVVKPELSLPCSQDPVNGPYPESLETSPYSHTLLNPTLILIFSYHLRLGLPMFFKISD